MSILLLATYGARAQEAPRVVDAHSSRLSISLASGNLFAMGSSATESRASQVAWGPGPVPLAEYLYVASIVHGVRRMEYDRATGELSNLVDVFPALTGQGIGFHVDDQGRSEMYVVENYSSANEQTVQLARLWRFVDVDGDGDFGGASDVSAPIAWGIPRGSDHSLNQIQFLGDTLHVGSGTRTRNGAVQGIPGDAYGESAYGGAILFIEDVNQVPTTPDAAGFPAYPSDPTAAEHADIVRGITLGADAPYTSTSPAKLRVHSAGTRNPFGLAIDRFGQLWFTNNFHRVNNSTYDRSILDATAEPDAFDGPSNNDVHDQLFAAVQGGDYGYRNSNWQGSAVAQAAGFFTGVSNPALITPTQVFDNLDQDGVSGPDLDSADAAFDQLHDPANPVGMGPHAALTGLDFGADHWPDLYRDQIFVARFNSGPSIVDGLFYRDLVIVDREDGWVERVVEGLASPTDVLADADGNLLVASWRGSIWRVAPTAVVPALGVASRIALVLAAMVLGWISIGRPRRGGNWL